MLWILLLMFPFPYIANTAGWMTAEIGRQPWLVYGLMRPSEGYSTHVSAGNSLFTLLGFLGMYSLLSVLWIVLVYRMIETGPEAVAPHQEEEQHSQHGVHPHEAEEAEPAVAGRDHLRVTVCSAQ